MEILIVGKQNCQWCDAAKLLCERKNLKYTFVDCINDWGPEQRYEFFSSGIAAGAKTVPQIVVNGQLIGGYDAFEGWIAGGKL